MDDWDCTNLSVVEYQVGPEPDGDGRYPTVVVTGSRPSEEVDTDLWYDLFIMGINGMGSPPNASDYASLPDFCDIVTEDPIDPTIRFILIEA